MSARPWPPTLARYRGSRARSNLNILRRGGRFRQRVAPFPDGRDVQIHCFANKPKGLFPCFPHNCAPWQVRYVRAKTILALFENYDVSHPNHIEAKAAASLPHSKALRAAALPGALLPASGLQQFLWIKFLHIQPAHGFADFR